MLRHEKMQPTSCYEHYEKALRQSPMNKIKNDEIKSNSFLRGCKIIALFQQYIDCAKKLLKMYSKKMINGRQVPNRKKIF